MSGIYYFIKYLRYRQTQTSRVNVENIRPRFGSPRRDPGFLTFRHHVWVATQRKSESDILPPTTQPCLLTVILNTLAVGILREPVM